MKDELKVRDRMRHIAREQAERTIKGARHVIITEGEKIVDIRENNVPSMDVFAVVGSSTHDDIPYESTVLLEIGRRYARPYHRARLLGHDGLRHEVNARLRFVPLSKEFLGSIWHELSTLVINDAWRIQGRKRLVFEQGNKSFFSGVTFTVAHEDKPLLAAVLQSEMRSRSNPLLEDMGKAAIWIVERLRPFEHIAFSSESDSAWRRMLRKENSGINPVLRFLENRKFLPHQHYLLQKQIAGKGCDDLYSRVVHMAGISDEKIHEWGALLNAENVPLFEDCYVWCKTVPPREERRRKDVRMAQAAGRAAHQWLSFYLTPKEMITMREDPSWVQGSLRATSSRKGNIPF